MIDNHLNLYANLLKQQGNYVIEVDDIAWFDYKGCMIPAYFPHCMPAITRPMAKEVLRRSGRFMARWSSHFDQVKTSEWWHVMREGTWSLNDCSGNTRSKIRRGQKCFQSRLVTPQDLLKQGYDICVKAQKRYSLTGYLPSYKLFKRKIESAIMFPGTVEYFGVFSGETLVGFSENYIQEDAILWESIWHDPEYLPRYSSYVLYDGMLAHYLNERKMKYCNDGNRSIYHVTNIQDHLMEVYGFVKKYSLLNVVYNPWLKIPITLAYVMRKPIFFLAERQTSNLFVKLAALVRQKQIAQSCKFPDICEVNGKTEMDDSVAIAPISEDSIPAVAHLHLVGLKDSFLSSLGPAPVKHLYQAILKSDQAFGFVALKNGEAIGFITGTENVGAIYKYVLGKYFFTLVLVFLPKMLSWRNLKYAIETLFYPFKIKGELPHSEILSVVVSEKARGLGIGRKLMLAAFNEFKRRGIGEVKVLVGAELTANEYYKQMSFKLRGAYHHHGYKLNIYTININDKV